MLGLWRSSRESARSQSPPADGWVWSCGRAAVLVLYPVFFPFQAALDVGDPQVRHDRIRFRQFQRHSSTRRSAQHIDGSVAATVMALAFVRDGVDLTRTNVPGRHRSSNMMAVPYYLTPLLARWLEPAWLAGKRFINQVWRALGGNGHVSISYGVRNRLGNALFEGSVAFVMIAAVMKSMDPRLRRHRRLSGPAGCATMVRITLPLCPRRSGAAIFCLCRMLGSFAAASCSGHPTLLCHHPRSTSWCAISAEDPGCPRRWACRCSP